MKVGEALKRSEAAYKAHETRRRRKAEADEMERQKAARSLRAAKAWETRRAGGQPTA